MLTFFLILGGSLVVGAAVYGLLSQFGLLPTETDERRGPSTAPMPGAPQVPHLRELPQGCLISIILAALVWFALWGVVLYLALRLLRSPFES